MRATSTTVVPVPIAKVWDIVADHEGIAKWGPGLTAEVVRAGDTERNGVGAVRRLKPKGPAPAIVEEITGFEAGSRLTYRAVSGVPFKNYNGEVALTKVAGGTRIDWTLNADQRVPVVEGVALKGLSAAMLHALKRYALRSA
jgi:uncharacterized protein YndB with AHSA1/START domain